MSWMAILIPVSILMGACGLWAFFWALRHHQFDDPKGNAWRILSPEAQRTPGNRAGKVATPNK